jgi:hypothetical protein
MRNRLGDCVVSFLTLHSFHSADLVRWLKEGDVQSWPIITSINTTITDSITKT